MHPPRLARLIARRGGARADLAPRLRARLVRVCGPILLLDGLDQHPAGEGPVLENPATADEHLDTTQCPECELDRLGRALIVVSRGKLLECSQSRHGTIERHLAECFEIGRTPTPDARPIGPDEARRARRENPGRAHRCFERLERLARLERVGVKSLGLWSHGRSAAHAQGIGCSIC